MGRKAGSNRNVVGRDVVERAEKVKEEGEPASEPPSMKVVVIKR
jgi:hypothetical protein